MAWFGFLLIAGGSFLIWGVLHYHAKQQQEEAEKQKRIDAATEAAVERDLEERMVAYRKIFPLLTDKQLRALIIYHTSEDSVRSYAKSIQASYLGTTPFGMPAILPISERRKHLYVVGKTGTGKTSLLIHLMKQDLEDRRGIGVIAPDRELFRDWLLPLVPEDRIDEVIYFAPGHPNNPLSLNPLAIEPDEDRSRAAEEFLSIFKRALQKDDMGTRTAPLIANTFSAMTGYPGMTLAHVRRFLMDEGFREQVLDGLGDSYICEFWRETYPSYPKGSHLPLINRLDQFLRPEPIRRALCAPQPNFSIRHALHQNHILFFDLSGLSPDNMLLFGQLLLAKFQLELFRRETSRQSKRTPFHLYADEFQTCATVSESTWRELLSRGRRYGLALTLANQYPSQLSKALQDEIFGNVSSLVVFGMGAKDAQVMHRELLWDDPDTDKISAIPYDILLRLQVGQAVVRLGSGAEAVGIKTLQPIPEQSQSMGERVQDASWEKSKQTPDVRVPPTTDAPPAYDPDAVWEQDESELGTNDGE